MFYCDIGDSTEFVLLGNISDYGYVSCCNYYVLISLCFVDGYSLFFECFEWDEILCVYVGLICNALYGGIFPVGMLLIKYFILYICYSRFRWDTYFSTTSIVLFLITCSLIFVIFYWFWSYCGVWFMFLYISSLLRCYNSMI